MNTEELVARAQELAIQFAPKIAAAIVILILGRWFARVMSRLVKSAVGRAGGDAVLVNFLGNLVYMALLAMVVVASLGQLGVQTTSFIAMLGAAGLAIGLALQGSLSNFAAGVLIVVLRPYRVGDFIEAAGVSGTVFEVQIFSTILTTPDNKRVIVPNGQIGASIITNFSANETRRVDLVFGASYDDDVGTVKGILTDIVESHEMILTEPPPRIVVTELADSSVNYGLFVWVQRANVLQVKFDVTEAVKRRFDDAGLSIPFPQLDVHSIGAKAA